jgi:formylglycine-generating enzyme required for sulfatase activity
MKDKGLRCALLSAAWVLSTISTHGDIFGTGDNQFTVDFVSVGNAGNGNDFGDYFSTCGGVAYNYRIGTYEISQDMINKATANGMANVTGGAWTGNQPAAKITWYEAAAFVNWLNVSKGYSPAYNLSYSGSWSVSAWGASDQATTGVRSGTNPFRNKGAIYLLPSEDEWYKAAYHKNDGVTANYWDYATAGNSVPDGIDFAGDPNYQAVIRDDYNQGHPNAITDAGSSSSAYGTYGQEGNVKEITESPYREINNGPNDDRTLRGGTWYDLQHLQHMRAGFHPGIESFYIGFRVASVPEPSSGLLGLIGLVAVWGRKRSTFSTGCHGSRRTAQCVGKVPSS